MYKTSLLQKLAVVIALALPAALIGQVPVDISSQKIITGGTAYYLHPVLKGQTLYSISRAYKVTIDDITRNNVIPPNGIQTEQVLKIPASALLTVAKPEPQSKPQPQPQSQPQTVPESQAKVNPQTQVGAQQQSVPARASSSENSPPSTTAKTEEQVATQPVAKPAEKKTVKAERDETHKVKKGESISSIARDHGITERELKKANKGLLFPMPGMYLMIPAKQEEGETVKKQE